MGKSAHWSWKQGCRSRPGFRASAVEDPAVGRCACAKTAVLERDLLPWTPVLLVNITPPRDTSVLSFRLHPITSDRHRCEMVVERLIVGRPATGRRGARRKVRYGA
jgi:hypothetical protein